MEFTANAIQSIDSNQNVLFTTSSHNKSSSIFHDDGSGIITLKGATNQSRVRFKITFGGNVALPTTGTAGPISLAITLNGEPILSSTVITTSATAGPYNAVDKTIFIDIPCGCCAQISIRNTTTQTINTQNVVLIVERTA